MYVGGMILFKELKIAGAVNGLKNLGLVPKVPVCRALKNIEVLVWKAAASSYRFQWLALSVQSNQHVRQPLASPSGSMVA